MWMILVFLFPLVLSAQAKAQNFYAVSKTESRTVYSEQKVCELTERTTCLDISGCSWDTCSLINKKWQIDPVKVAAKEAEAARIAKLIAEAAERRQRMQVSCADQGGLMKDLCDELLKKEGL